MNKQTFSRAWYSFRLLSMTSSGKRANYLRNKKVFHHVGENCTIVERKIPLYPKLISIGNNVHLEAKVLLVPHDAIHLCLNNLARENGEDASFREKIGCIEIGDNVFVGSNTTILCNVRIGSKVIIGAGSLVNKDIPDNSVAVGTPARVIGTFDDFVTKRRNDEMYPQEITPRGHVLSKEQEDWFWTDMQNRRK